MPSKLHSKAKPLRIGVLLAPPPIQLLDLAPIDLFHILSEEYLAGLNLLPQAVKDLAIDTVEIFYIIDEKDKIMLKPSDQLSRFDKSSAVDTPFNESTNTLLAPLTANMHIQVTATVRDKGVQPDSLSVLMIPGPDPSSAPSQAYKDFICAHAECGLTDIITICTGIYPACHAGICNGRVVAGPRGLLPDLRSKFPKVVRFEDKRWSTDTLSTLSTGGKEERPAELWTAAGITNGLDCVAAYIRAHFNPELAEIVCRLADVGDRPREYDVGRARDQAWWVSTILRTVFKGFWRSLMRR